MQPHKNNNDFHDRLQVCIDRVGGKRALATEALISEAQLFRYLNGESDLPRDRLIAIAKAANVDPGWLLVGEGDMVGGEQKDPRPSFRAELMAQVVQTFEELLIESDKKYTPRQRAHAVTLIYDALRLEESRRHAEMDVDMKLAPYFPDILAPLRADSRMEDYRQAIHSLEYGGELSLQALRQFDATVKMAMESAFEGAAGEIHFEHMGTNLLPEAAKILLQNVDECIALVGKTEIDWLDAGCGNGRHLAFLAQHCPNLRLKGYEASQLALNLCEQMVRGGKLPAGVVERADFRNMPYPNDSIDVVYCRGGLNLLPYIPGQPVGATQFVKEVARVLRPGGVATMLTLEGTGRDYIYFSQYHTPESIAELAAEADLDVVKITLEPTNETGGKLGKDYSNKFGRGLKLILRKRA